MSFLDAGLSFLISQAKTIIASAAHTVDLEHRDQPLNPDAAKRAVQAESYHLLKIHCKELEMQMTRFIDSEINKREF